MLSSFYLVAQDTKSLDRESLTHFAKTSVFFLGKKDSVLLMETDLKPTAHWQDIYTTGLCCTLTHRSNM